MTMSDRIAVMNRGRYEQLGEPEALYERPSTRFVAAFLGVSNLLAARPDGTADGYAVFRLTDDTPIRVPRALLDGRTGPLSVGVRPEKIRLFDAHGEVPASANLLEGVVRDASYLGVSTQYIIELRDGKRITVYEQNVERATRAELWSPGEEVRLAWSADHSFVVAEEAADVEAYADEAVAATA